MFVILYTPNLCNIDYKQATGLADLIIAISDPGAFGTFEHPVVESSFRLYDWGNSFYGLLHDWTPDTSELYVDVSFLSIFSSNRSMDNNIGSGLSFSFLIHQ